MVAVFTDREQEALAFFRRINPELLQVWYELYSRSIAIDTGVITHFETRHGIKEAVKSANLLTANKRGLELVEMVMKERNIEPVVFKIENPYKL